MPQLIGLAGVIGSGKTYQRDLLIAKGFIAIDFKDALIDMAEDLVGYPIRSDYELFKESVVGVPMDTSKRIVELWPNAMTGRRLLQRLGTEVMRKRDPDYWVNAWKEKARGYLKGGFSVVTADVRFENEVSALEGFSHVDFSTVEATVMFCDYKSDRYNASSKHPSEAFAQKLLACGFKDGDRVRLSDLKS